MGFGDKETYVLDLLHVSCVTGEGCLTPLFLSFAILPGKMSTILASENCNGVK